MEQMITPSIADAMRDEFAARQQSLRDSVSINPEAWNPNRWALEQHSEVQAKPRAPEVRYVHVPGPERVVTRLWPLILPI